MVADLQSKNYKAEEKYRLGKTKDIHSWCLKRLKQILKHVEVPVVTILEQRA
jgi:hypothetical protein